MAQGACAPPPFLAIEDHACSRLAQIRYVYTLAHSLQLSTKWVWLRATMSQDMPTINYCIACKIADDLRCRLLKLKSMQDDFMHFCYLLLLCMYVIII